MMHVMAREGLRALFAASGHLPGTERQHLLAHHPDQPRMLKAPSTLPTRIMSGRSGIVLTA